MHGSSRVRRDIEAAPSLWQVVVSVASAFFGVQSSANRERDFTRGRPALFLLIGFVMTAVVVLLFYLATRGALHLAV